MDLNTPKDEQLQTIRVAIDDRPTNTRPSTSTFPKFKIHYFYMTNVQITPQEEESLERKFQHLMTLLSVSAMPEDIKEAWVAMLPEMKLAQVNRLIKILEQEAHRALEYAQDHPEDQRLLDKLKEARQFHEEEDKNIEARTMAALLAIEDELLSAPQAPQKTPPTSTTP